MSRIGKKPIEIPKEVEVSLEGKRIEVKGPKGNLAREIHAAISIKREGNYLLVFPQDGPRDDLRKPIRALWGLTRALIWNMIKGVTEGYEKRLEIEGIGYRAILEGRNLVLNVGFIHPLKLFIPENVVLSINKNIVTVGGVDKEKVGQFAALIRKAKPAEPYKGKGIKYEGEQIRRKLGKRAAGAEAKEIG